MQNEGWVGHEFNVEMTLAHVANLSQAFGKHLVGDGNCVCCVHLVYICVAVPCRRAVS